MREFEKVIDLPVFRYHVKIIITESVVKSRQARTEGLGPYEKEDTNPAAMHTGVKGKNWSYLFFRFNPGIGDVSHECFHCIWRLMRWIGADLENEVVAYHLTYLTEEVWKFAKSVEDLPDPNPEKQLDDLAAKYDGLDTKAVEK